MTESAFLGKVGVFSLLDAAEIEAITGYLDSAELAAGEDLFHEGDVGNDLYILKQGLVSVILGLPDGSSQELARLAAGEFFGEMSVVDNAPRSATCRALESSSLYRLSREGFSAIVTDHAAVAMKLMYRMLNIATRRLHETSDLVADMVQWGENARRRAITDELTGAYNRRFLDDALGAYVAEAGEKGAPLSLVMADLDYFRRINELGGEASGDMAIKEAARVFKACLRPRDVLARYGGDEFVILLPATGPDEAVTLASSVCRQTACVRLALQGTADGHGLTTSMGVATFPEHARDLAGLKAAADAALYKAKEEGRNRVERADLGGA